MRLLLLVNATASSVTPRRRVVIEAALRADHELEVTETVRRGHAARLARAAARAGTEVVAVLGGDGTVSEAADGLAGTRTALAALPGGSTNVFTRTIGLPDDPVDATATLLEALRRRAVRPMGLGRVDGRHFLFHCGIGFDAAVVARVEAGASALKRVAPHPLFAWTAADVWLRHYERRRPRFRVETSDGTGADGVFAIVSNTSPYTYLGRRPITVAPEAGPDRPLSITVFHRPGTLTLLGLAAAALWRPSLLRRSRQVSHHTAVTKAEVTSANEDPFPYQVDGDYLGERARLELSYAPDALRVVMPAS